MNESPRVIVALDYPDALGALNFAERIDPGRANVKVGKELFTRAGPDVVRKLVDSGFQVFLDLKYHDIPNTVAAACRAAADLGVWMVNVHAHGGRRMMSAAREALADDGPLLIAVTVLTSMDRNDLTEVGIQADPAEQVLNLALLAQDCGLDGVVCSARELGILAPDVAADFLRVTPGIRPAGSAQDDQRRVMTPAEAVAKGASYLVIGRPITAAADPMQALADIEAELA